MALQAWLWRAPPGVVGDFKAPGLTPSKRVLLLSQTLSCRQATPVLAASRPSPPWQRACGFL